MTPTPTTTRATPASTFPVIRSSPATAAHEQGEDRERGHDRRHHRHRAYQQRRVEKPDAQCDAEPGDDEVDQSPGAGACPATAHVASDTRR